MRSESEIVEFSIAALAFARAESVDAAPSYREAFKRRRCLIPTDGFYEYG
jgi:putative SOS response-associated peptidase YedK